MSPHHWTLAGTAWFLLTSVSYAQTARDADPLFQSQDILDVRIIAPLTTLATERPDEEEIAGKFQYTTTAGELEEIDISLRTRGRFRRREDICNFPPLRVNFKKSQTKKSLFHKQDKVKLVTHCRNNSKRYQQVVLSEYTAYRILNVLTDISFRVRLMRITYVNTEKKNRERQSYGFFIESEDRLTKRLDSVVSELARAQVRALDPAYMNLISMYHYLIGNTDFSPIAGAEDTCCHNHVLMGKEGELLYSVPYDFDQAGLVNAPHAGANPRFKLRNVRQRLYRGRCVNNANIDRTIARFNEKKEGILELVSNEQGIEGAPNKAMSRYVKDFYAVIDSPKRVQSQLVKKCI